MMKPEEFRKHAHQLVDWMLDYYENIDKFPVKSQVSPGEILSKLPASAPQSGESMDQILKDFNELILPGMTHWQNPNFFAYFPANASFPSLLAEMLTATLASQCMIWDTSPAAAELEEQMMNWLKQMTGLPTDWAGVIQDGASTATLTAILTARETKSAYRINKEGFNNGQQFRVYCSTETHSSVEKAVKIAGLGKSNLIKIAVDDSLAMDAKALEKAIAKDLSAGFIPLCVIAALGTTGTTAMDPLEPIASICKKHEIWLHVDAAYAGTALLLPEYRWMIEGIEEVDSFVFNPHKWMFTHFDCTAYFVKDEEALVRTFEILPEYLKTQSRGKVKDYRDWGIPMGRRFRALKLWFVIRSFGIEGLQTKIRKHIQLAERFESWVLDHPDFEIMTKRTLNLVCFRYHPHGISNEVEINQLNENLENSINSEGNIFLTHTKVHGKYTLRMVIAQTNVEEKHVEEAWGVILSNL
ncbi:MAG: aminotransferase class I/II-fold pyridoxal phosphate-dependent enzyme [Bacteroidota bacterium]|nr:aminotransferase class I/II-fold pyridoxal phosphate-dependent enzyme [Bacteroidota bacterium]